MAFKDESTKFKLAQVAAVAKRCTLGTAAFCVLSALLAPFSQARADEPVPPAFEYAAAEKVKAVEWKAQVKGGLLVSGGNAQVTNGSLSGTASRKAGNNKFALDAGGAYGRSDNRVFVPTGGGDPSVVDSPADIQRQKITSTSNWSGKARYDRFLTENNSVYALTSIAADKIAGKKLFGGGQIGYSRQLFKNLQHLVVTELGYDFSYESYYATDAQSVSIHSARLFAGETWKLNATTGLYANIEALFNLNKETNALDAKHTTVEVKGVDPFKDTRLIGKAGLTATIWKNLSFGFGLTFRYDQNPAPLKAPDGVMFGTPAAFFQPFANQLDTIVEGSLILTLL